MGCFHREIARSGGTYGVNFTNISNEYSEWIHTETHSPRKVWSFFSIGSTTHGNASFLSTQQPCHDAHHAVPNNAEPLPAGWHSSWRGGPRYPYPGPKPLRPKHSPPPLELTHAASPKRSAHLVGIAQPTSSMAHHSTFGCRPTAPSPAARVADLHCTPTCDQRKP